VNQNILCLACLPHIPAPVELVFNGAYTTNFQLPSNKENKTSTQHMLRLNVYTTVEKGTMFILIALHL